MFHASSFQVKNVKKNYIRISPKSEREFCRPQVPGVEYLPSKEDKKGTVPKKPKNGPEERSWTIIRKRFPVRIKPSR